MFKEIDGCEELEDDCETREKLLIAKQAIKIDDIFNGGAYFSWCMTGTGFGQLSFNVDQKTQVITCMNECMSRDTVRKILVAFANHIADNAILEDA